MSCQQHGARLWSRAIMYICTYTCVHSSSSIKCLVLPVPILTGHYTCASETLYMHCRTLVCGLCFLSENQQHALLALSTRITLSLLLSCVC